ncbi:MAG: peptidoglycan-binding protein [Alphaproteobacteria bacterium]
MSFTRTNEGRVFFQNANNDDIPTPPVKQSVPKPAPGVTEPIMPRDNTQMQILLLLKSLNAKLKSSKNDQESLKSQLLEYKKTIKTLEDKTTEQQSNYIDLEQKVSRKQSEVSKKAERVEDRVKKTLEQISEAKSLVKAIEEKASTYDASFTAMKDISRKQTLTLNTLKEEITSQKKLDSDIAEKQKTLEKKQTEQGEKMVSSVAAYVALTKRVSEAEARHESIDNKIEEARSDYIKLDRKIDKALEDRNRILRKVERIEQAVLETRDALNAKAMVLLTDQGAVAGVHMPQERDDSLQTDPAALNRRLQEEAQMPIWRRPVRLQGASLVMMMVIVLLLGWIASSALNTPSKVVMDTERALPPTISLDAPYSENSYQQKNTEVTEPSSYVTEDTYQDTETPNNQDYSTIYAQTTEDMSPVHEDKNTDEYGITIHKGYSDPSQINKQPQSISTQNDTASTLLDVQNTENLERAFEESPEQLAQALNAIEPGEPQEITQTASYTPPAERIEIKQPEMPKTDNSAYIASLKNRISPDSNLTDIAKKIETQAFEGIPEAQHDMGALYVAGHGQIKQDLKRAIFWFTEASQNGIANAKYNLGVLNHQGMGVEKNVDRAMSLYKDAANMGHPEAQYNLGIANIEGIGVPYNPTQAAQYFQKAADHGVTEAAYNLGLIYENGLLGQPQPEEALTWYKIAADAGSPEAQSALEQLANALGINVEDVKRIVDKVRGASPLPTTSNQSALISDIQGELMRRGLYPGPVDGQVGPMTKSAIESFQRAANLSVTGTPNQELLSYLKATSQYAR